MTTPAWKYKAVGSKDDTLPCKRQALAWENEPKAWIQGFQALENLFWLHGVSLAL